jgi:hypothetical protein
MAKDMFLSFGEIARRRDQAPISHDDMEKIMWKNTARLWKIRNIPIRT